MKKQYKGAIIIDDPVKANKKLQVKIILKNKNGLTKEYEYRDLEEAKDILEEIVNKGNDNMLKKIIRV